MSCVCYFLIITHFFCCFYLIETVSDAGFNTHSRQRRQTAPEYRIDILVLTDYSVWKWWYDLTEASDSTEARREETERSIRQYFTLLIREVSDNFGFLKTSFHLKFLPVGFYIVKNEDLATSWTVKNVQTKLVDVDPALKRLEDWLSQQTSLPSFDHALLFTGENLTSGKDGNEGFTAGYGKVGTICKKVWYPAYQSLSLVEDRGAFDSVSIAMHELGHGLNATHDGEGTNRCRGEDRYVMANGNYDITDSNRRNRWFFSQCSANEMQKYVEDILKTQEGATCLREWFSQRDVPDVTGVIPGQLEDADAQCRRLHGPSSSYYYYGNLSEVCMRLSCGDPSDTTGSRYFYHIAATGTTCGHKKWCQVGECVPSSSAPSVPSCYRDQATIIDGQRCPDFIEGNPNQCYYPRIYNYCCQSCDTKNSGIPGCPYGDRRQGCQQNQCNNIYSDGRIRAYDCCDTCDFDVSTWACSDVTLVDGLDCTTAVKKWGYQQCYNWTIAFLCCATCEALRDTTRKEGCEYGDLKLNGCEAPGPNDLDIKCDIQNCCDTCDVTTDSGAFFSTRLTWIANSVLIFWHVIMFAFV